MKRETGVNRGIGRLGIGGRARRRALSTLVALAVLAAAPARPVTISAASPAKRLVIVSWDGAADWAIDRLLAEGRLPNLARIVRDGVRAEYSTPAYPSKTACGHAAIWTGAYGDVNGVSGNDTPLLPRSEHTLLESHSGYSSESLLAEPIWITAAKARKRTAVLAATQIYPFDRDRAALATAPGARDRFYSFSGFESRFAEPSVFGPDALVPASGWSPLPAHRGEPREIALSVADTRFFALVYDDPADPVDGADTVLVRQNAKTAGGPEAVLKPLEARAADAPASAEGFSPRFRVTKGALYGFTYFRLFELAPDMGRFALYQRAVSALPGLAPPGEGEAYFDAYGGFYDDPFWSLYRPGALGKQIWEGGDGTAERRTVEMVRFDVDMRKRGTRFAFDRWKPEFLIHYTPMIDSAGHTWVGVFDPDSPRYDAAIAAKLWPYYAAVVALEDEWLGEIMRLAGPNAVVCLVSDHGMVGIGKEFFPNAVLERAGLLARTEKETIDLARTKACVPPWSDFFVNVNGTDWKGGIVAPEDRDAALRAATDALLAATDPETGKHLVTRVFRTGDVVGLGMGGPTGGDLYFDVAPGYVPSGELSHDLVKRTKSPVGSGEHGFFPLRTKMQAICFMYGPGVAKGRSIPGVRQIDIAPTLTHLFGIPAPHDARGRVVHEALADR